MLSVLDSGSNGLGSSPYWEHCVVFLGKTLYSQSVSLCPGAQIGISEFNAMGNPAMDQYPIQGAGAQKYSQRLYATGGTCKLWPDGHLAHMQSLPFTCIKVIKITKGKGQIH